MKKTPTKPSSPKRGPNLYRVSFVEENCLFMDIDASTEAEAIRKCEALYDRNGTRGFSINMKRGGISDWEATLIVHSSPNGGPTNA